MNLQPRFESYISSLEFLRNSVGLEYKTSGATLDSTAFGDVAVNGYIQGGTAVYLDEATGLYVPWGADTPATALGAGLVAHDIELIEGSNPIAGIIVAGHPIEERCIGVTDTFIEATRGYLRFDA